MSKKATGFQKRAMSIVYRGRKIFKPLNTGWTGNFDFAFASEKSPAFIGIAIFR